MNAAPLRSSVVCRPFLGRERELAELAALHKSATQGRGAIALVSSDAGVGKTRLVTEFRRLTGGRALIAEHACREYIQAPLLPFAEILSGFVAKVPPVAESLSDDVALLQHLAAGEPPAGKERIERIDRLQALTRIFGALARSTRSSRSSRTSIGPTPPRWICCSICLRSWTTRDCWSSRRFAAMNFAAGGR